MNKLPFSYFAQALPFGQVLLRSSASIAAASASDFISKLIVFSYNSLVYPLPPIAVYKLNISCNWLYSS